MEGRNDSNGVMSENCGREVVTRAPRRCRRASDRCGRGLRQGSVRNVRQGG